MSASIVSGAEAAKIQAFILKKTGSRGYRQKVSPELRLMVLRSGKLNRKDLAEVSLAARALANYRASIGDNESAERWREFSEDAGIVSDEKAGSSGFSLKDPLSSLRGKRGRPLKKVNEVKS